MNHLIAFVHIRVWPYRRQETNFHKAVSDFTICFVFYLCSIQATESAPPEDTVFTMLQLMIVFMWRVLVPLSLIGAIASGIRRERRAVKEQTRREMLEGGQLFALTQPTKTALIDCVSSLDSLARLDDTTWIHRQLFRLRRRSSLRERVLCTCEPGRAALCVQQQNMICEGRRDHDILLNCRKIPFRWSVSMEES